MPSLAAHMSSLAAHIPSLAAHMKHLTTDPHIFNKSWPSIKKTYGVLKMKPDDDEVQVDG